MKKIIEELKNIDENIIKIRNVGIKASIVLFLCFTYILRLYTINPVSHFAFDIGYLGIKCSLMFLVSFFVWAFGVDKILKNTR